MPARLSRSRRSFAFASAFATVVVLAGCQAILGIDPDARHDAVNDLADSSFSDAPALDSSGGNEGGVVLDTGTGACVSSECPTAGLGPCEENVCGDAGVCEIVSRDGQKCGADGTCRGYACIGSTSEIASAGDTTCVTTVDGVVWCWGADPSGILGDQGSTPRSTPYVVPLIAEGGSAGAKHVSLGHAHGCAVLTNNDLVCWGSDEFGQASGTEDAGAAVLPPTQFSVSSGASSVAAGFGHTCIVDLEQNVWCWGRNGEGELGAGPGLPAIVRTPTQAVGIGELVDQISGAWKTVCARANGTVQCWGDNTWGQLGTFVTDSFSPTPTAIDGLGHDLEEQFPQASEVSAGWGNVCVTMGRDRTLECTGNDRDGQLGFGEHVDDGGLGSAGDAPHSKPQPPSFVDPGGTLTSLDEVDAIWMGTSTHLCARVSFATTLYCAGRNHYGELGYPAGPTDDTPTFYALATTMPQTKGASIWSMGDDHACELVRGGDGGWTVECVGHNDQGQLGGYPLMYSSMDHPREAVFPGPPGGLRKLRASQ